MAGSRASEKRQCRDPLRRGARRPAGAVPLGRASGATGRPARGRRPRVRRRSRGRDRRAPRRRVAGAARRARRVAGGSARAGRSGLEGIVDDLRARAAALSGGGPAVPRRAAADHPAAAPGRGAARGDVPATYACSCPPSSTSTAPPGTSRRRRSTSRSPCTPWSPSCRSSAASPAVEDVRVHPFVAFCPYREVESSELARWDVSQGQPNPYVPYADPVARDPRDVFSPALRFDPGARPAVAAARPGPGRRPRSIWPGSPARSTWSATRSSSAASPA